MGQRWAEVCSVREIDGFGRAGVTALVRRGRRQARLVSVAMPSSSNVGSTWLMPNYYLQRAMPTTSDNMAHTLWTISPTSTSEWIVAIETT